METKTCLKKLYLDKDLKPIIQKNANGVIILYSSDNKDIKYELTYHYFMR